MALAAYAGLRWRRGLRARSAGGRPAYLYASAADCQASLRTGPKNTNNRPLLGVVAVIPPGASLSVTGEDIGKEGLCLRVEYGAARGYVLASGGWIDPPGRDR